jgi:hypothetical protein
MTMDEWEAQRGALAAEYAAEIQIRAQLRRNIEAERKRAYQRIKEIEDKIIKLKKQ